MCTNLTALCAHTGKTVCTYKCKCNYAHRAGNCNISNVHAVCFAKLQRMLYATQLHSPKFRWDKHTNFTTAKLSVNHSR